MDILDLYNSAAGQTVGEENMETSGFTCIEGGLIWQYWLSGVESLVFRWRLC